MGKTGGGVLDTMAGHKDIKVVKPEISQTVERKVPVSQPIIEQRPAEELEQEQEKFK